MLCVVSCTKQYEMSIAKADERETQLTSEIKTLEVELVQLRAIATAVGNPVDECMESNLYLRHFTGNNPLLVIST